MSSSPNLDARFKITAIKVVLVLLASQLTSQHKWQAGLALWLSLWAWWINFWQVWWQLEQLLLLLLSAGSSCLCGCIHDVVQFDHSGVAG